VTWAGEVPGTTESAIGFDVTVESDAALPFGTVIENVARLSDKFAGPVLGTLTAYTGVGSGADLEIEKMVDILYGSTGDTLSFKIVFGNAGVETARNVVMMDEVPAYLDVVAGSVTASKASSGMLYDGGMIQWEGDLAPAEEVTVSFRATIDEMTPSKMALINAAYVTADNYPIDVMDSSVTEVGSIRFIYLPIISR
jgi:uncharacterized repeat protein (TIGR01451 family)